MAHTVPPRGLYEALPYALLCGLTPRITSGGRSIFQTTSRGLPEGIDRTVITQRLHLQNLPLTTAVFLDGLQHHVKTPPPLHPLEAEGLVSAAARPKDRRSFSTTLATELETIRTPSGANHLHSDRTSASPARLLAQRSSNKPLSPMAQKIYSRLPSTGSAAHAASETAEPLKPL